MKKNLLVLSFILVINIANAQWHQETFLPSLSLASNSSNIFAGTIDEISRNSGGSWSHLSGGLPVPPLDWGGTAIAAKDNTIYTEITDAVDIHTVYKSIDNGDNWTSFNTGLPINEVTSFAFSGTNLFAATNGAGLYTNNGSDWSAYSSTGLTNLNVTSLLVTSFGFNGLIGTMGGGVFLEDAGGWGAINTGLTSKNVTALVGNTVTNFYAGTSDSGVFHYTSFSAVKINNGLNNLKIKSLAVTGSNLFAGTDGGGVFYSSNGGANWSEANTGLGNNLTVNSIIINGPDVYIATGSFFGSGGGVFKRGLGDFGTITSINENKNFQFSIYPNPSVENISITTKEGISNGTVRLINVTGQIVFEKANLTGKNFSFDISDLASGIYILELSENSNISRMKIAKN